MTKVIVVGAGGHARVLVSLLGYLPQIEIVGVADRDDSSLGEEIGGTRVIATWDALPEWRSRGVEGVVLALGNNELRRRMFHAVQAMGFRVLGLRHPTALVEPGAVIGPGSVLCAGVMVCAAAQIGKNVLLNTGVIIEHECRIGDHAQIASGARLGGRVTVGDRAFIGLGSSVKDQLCIGRDVIVGAGSVVVSDLAQGVVAYGVPARVARVVLPGGGKADDGNQHSHTGVSSEKERCNAKRDPQRTPAAL